MKPKAPKFSAGRIRLSQLMPLAHEIAAQALAPSLISCPASLPVVGPPKS